MSSGSPQNSIAGNQPNRLVFFAIEGRDSEAIKTAFQSALSIQVHRLHKLNSQLFQNRNAPSEKRSGRETRRGSSRGVNPKSRKPTAGNMWETLQRDLLMKIASGVEIVVDQDTLSSDASGQLPIMASSEAAHGARR